VFGARTPCHLDECPIDSSHDEGATDTTVVEDASSKLGFLCLHNRWQGHGWPEAPSARRGVAVGRKKHYGSRSERGTQVAALFYSLIESVKLCGVEPRGYLGEAARRGVRSPGTVTLPRDFK
jgi:hypothetical protein